MWIILIYEKKMLILYNLQQKGSEPSFKTGRICGFSISSKICHKTKEFWIACDFLFEVETLDSGVSQSVIYLLQLSNSDELFCEMAVSWELQICLQPDG